MTEDDHRHGTVGGFFAGCLCQPCRRAYSRDEKHRKHEARVGNPRRVNALGTQRRIQALMRMGWSTADLAREGGWQTDRQIQNLLYDRQYVYRETAHRIADQYDRLSMRVGPTADTARRATKAGYAPPLAWDDIDNDPEPRTDSGDLGVDLVVVLRLLQGDRVPSTKAEKDAAMARWLEQGGKQHELCRWHGWREGRYGLAVVRDTA